MSATDQHDARGKQERSKYFAELLERFTAPAVLMGIAGFVAWTAVAYVIYVRRVANIENVYVDAGLDVLGKLGEFFFLIGCLHFLYAVFAKRSEQEFFRQELHNALEKDLDLKRISESLNTVVANSRSFLNIVGQLDPDVFEQLWFKFAATHDTFIIIGSFPAGLVDVFRKRKDDAGLRLRFYCNLGTMPDKLIDGILQLCSELGSDAARLYHAERFDPGAIIIGTDFKAAAVEVLIDFSSSEGQRPFGCHVFGEAAVLLLTSIRTRLAPLEAPSLPGNAANPVRIVGRKDADFVIEHRETYRQTINSLSEGEPVKGAGLICQRMTQLLERTATGLDITHVARDDQTADMLADPLFQTWLTANYAAANGNGRTPITVRRLLLIEPDLGAGTKAKLIALMKDMSAHGVQIRYLYLNEIEEAYHEDFSLYDDANVIFIRYNGRGGWHPEAEARHSSDLETVRAFRRIYDKLFNKAKPFEQSATSLLSPQ